MLRSRIYEPETFEFGDRVAIYRHGSGWLLPARVTEFTPHHVMVNHKGRRKSSGSNRTRHISPRDETDEPSNDAVVETAGTSANGNWDEDTGDGYDDHVEEEDSTDNEVSEIPTSIPSASNAPPDVPSAADSFPTSEVYGASSASEPYLASQDALHATLPPSSPSMSAQQSRAVPHTDTPHDAVHGATTPTPVARTNADDTSRPSNDSRTVDDPVQATRRNIRVHHDDPTSSPPPLAAPTDIKRRPTYAPPSMDNRTVSTTRPALTAVPINLSDRRITPLAGR